MNDLTWIGIDDMKGGSFEYEGFDSDTDYEYFESTYFQLASNDSDGESTINIYVTIGLLCIF